MKLSDIKFLPGFYILISLGLLIVPFKWLAAWIAAAVIHEMFHVLFLLVFGYRILSVEIGMMGASIKTDGQSGVKMSACALAGPLGGFLLLFLLRVTPRLALCGAIQSLYNLIPVYPLDGGRVLKGIIERCFPEATAKKLLIFMENTALVLLAVTAWYAAVKLHLGLFPVLWIGLLVAKNKKFPCKHERLRVQ